MNKKIAVKRVPDNFKKSYPIRKMQSSKKKIIFYLFLAGGGKNGENGRVAEIINVHNNSDGQQRVITGSIS